MIYTLTVNPAIDMNITTNGLHPKLVNRTEDVLYTPNGKGLNVSFVLHRYGIQSTIIGFFGGFSGKYIVDESRKIGVKVHPIEIEETTRINIFLNDGNQEYKLVNAGATIVKEKQKEMLDFIESATDMTYLTINGSLPPGIEDAYLDEVFKLCSKKGVKVILDTSSQKLAELLSYHPYLIKPNDEEIEKVFNIKMRDENDVIDTLEYLFEQGAKNIYLTLGEKGSYFYNGKVMYYASAVPITLVSSACAGDGALGGFLSLWLEDENDIEKALIRASAIGANVAESNGLGDFKHVREYEKRVNIRRIK